MRARVVVATMYLAIGTVGCYTSLPSPVVYQVVPQPPPAAIVVSPAAATAMAAPLSPYQQVFLPRPYDDPKLILFQNWSRRATLTVTVDAEKVYVLPPGEQTPFLWFEIGDHHISVRAEVPSAVGPPVKLQPYSLVLTIDGRPIQLPIWLGEQR